MCLTRIRGLDKNIGMYSCHTLAEGDITRLVCFNISDLWNFIGTRSDRNIKVMK